ncbi:MAG: hypothetical protein PUP46_07090 [Endozoicomonas sp. (ex Botrylloides leachii)]|nr:hypothetical protein [Endozoicomonas sp. (ex Botrylloides leachii)]
MKKLKDDDGALKLSEIETSLINDTSGEFRDNLMSTLYDQMVLLKNRQHHEMPPEVFERIDSLVLALAAAGDTVANVWKKHHKQVLQPDI